MTITRYDFFKTKYGEELLIDLIRLEDLEKYIRLSPVQRLSYYDVTLITEGSGTFRIDTYAHRLDHGMVFFSAPGQVRKWDTSDTPRGYVLIFEEEFLGTFFNDKQFVQNLACFDLHTPAVIQLEPHDCTALVALLKDIRNEIAVFKQNDKHVLRALLYQVLTVLNRKFTSAYPASDIQPPNRYINRFIQLVDTHCHQHRSVDHYARQLFVTTGHLNSLVREHLGTSAKRYILGHAMLEAKRMLLYTQYSIDEIACRMNYANASYFVRVFRQHMHMTPSHFRKAGNP